MMPSPSNHSKAQAFTLVELLVAMAVLTMLVVLVLQIVTTSSDAVTTNSRRLKNVTAGTAILDRMDHDFAVRIQNQALPFFFLKSNGSDGFALYSEVQGYTGSRKLAAVQYRVTPASTSKPIELERGVSGTEWDDVFPTTPPSADPADFETLSDHPFRMEIAFLLNNGEIVALPPSDQSSISGVIVAVALLDASSRAMLTNTQISDLAGLLPDAKDGEEPLVQWENTRKLPDFGEGIAPRALQNIQFFQRTFYVQ